MEDKGDIIYYIVMAIVTLIGWIANWQKKQQKQQAQPPIPPVVPSNQQTPPPPPPPRRRKTAFIPSMQPLSSDVATPSLVVEQPVVADITDATPIDVTDLTDPDSIRRAFIYSEIITRKY